MSSKVKIPFGTGDVTRAARIIEGHRSAVVGSRLSASGKSTLAHFVEEQLHQGGHKTFVFDGDNVRHGLCGDLGFSAEGRAENLRRIGEMSKLFLAAGVISMAAFISPFRNDRARVRDIVGTQDVIEVYARCPLETCEARDVQGIYKKARAGEIPEFTGISSPNEEPLNPE